MLKLSVALLLASASLSAADPPPLPSEDKLEVLLKIVVLQQSQSNMIQAQQALQGATDEFQAYISGLRERLGVDEACNLSLAAEWVCPVEVPEDEKPQP